MSVIDDGDLIEVIYATPSPDEHGGGNIAAWIDELHDVFGAEPQGSDGRETVVRWRSRSARRHYEEVMTLRHILSSQYARLEAMDQSYSIVLPESIVKALREVVKAYAQHQEVQVVPVRREESEE
jgi:hypothetical protein